MKKLTELGLSLVSVGAILCLGGMSCSLLLRLPERWSFWGFGSFLILSSVGISLMMIDKKLAGEKLTRKNFGPGWVAVMILMLIFMMVGGVVIIAKN